VCRSLDEDAAAFRGHRARRENVGEARSAKSVGLLRFWRLRVGEAAQAIDEGTQMPQNVNITRMGSEGIAAWLYSDIGNVNLHQHPIA